MKTVLLSALCLLLLIGCSDNEKKKVYDPPVLAEIPDFEIVVPTAGQLTEMEDVISEQIPYGDDHVLAYPLEQFINFTHPQIYRYELTSDDNDGNWSPRRQSMPELTWNEIKTGFLVPEKNHRSFFPDDDIVNTYNVKSLGYIRAYHTINVIREGTVIMFQIGALPTEVMTYKVSQDTFENVAVTPLSNLISDYVTTKKTDYQYLLQCVQTPQQLFSWEQMERSIVADGGVYLLNPQNIASQKFEDVISITLVEDSRFVGK